MWSIAICPLTIAELIIKAVVEEMQLEVDEVLLHCWYENPKGKIGTSNSVQGTQTAADRACRHGSLAPTVSVYVCVAGTDSYHRLFITDTAEMFCCH